MTTYNLMNALLGREPMYLRGREVSRRFLGTLAGKSRQPKCILPVVLQSCKLQE